MVINKLAAAPVALSAITFVSADTEDVDLKDTTVVKEYATDTKDVDLSETDVVEKYETREETNKEIDALLQPIAEKHANEMSINGKDGKNYKLSEVVKDKNFDIVSGGAKLNDAERNKLSDVYKKLEEKYDGEKIKAEIEKQGLKGDEAKEYLLDSITAAEDEAKKEMAKLGIDDYKVVQSEAGKKAEEKKAEDKKKVEKEPDKRTNAELEAAKERDKELAGEGGLEPQKGAKKDAKADSKTPAKPADKSVKNAGITNLPVTGSMDYTIAGFILTSVALAFGVRRKKNS